MQIQNAVKCECSAVFSCYSILTPNLQYVSNKNCKNWKKMWRVRSEKPKRERKGSETSVNSCWASLISTLGLSTHLNHCVPNKLHCRGKNKAYEAYELWPFVAFYNFLVLLLWFLFLPKRREKLGEICEENWSKQVKKRGCGVYKKV